MPVYLVTFHAYLSWSEADPQGYIVKRKGVYEPDETVAMDRRHRAKHPPMRFDEPQQLAIHEVVVAISVERELRLHASSTCPTHAHALVSFRSPECACGSMNHCADDCGARQVAEAFVQRLKQKVGQRLAKDAGTSGRPYLSAGFNVTRVADRGHFEHLVEEYLPDHKATQGGIFKSY